MKSQFSNGFSYGFSVKRGPHMVRFTCNHRAATQQRLRDDGVADGRHRAAAGRGGAVRLAGAEDFLGEDGDRTRKNGDFVIQLG